MKLFLPVLLLVAGIVAVALRTRPMPETESAQPFTGETVTSLSEVISTPAATHSVPPSGNGLESRPPHLTVAAEENGVGELPESEEEAPSEERELTLDVGEIPGTLNLLLEKTDGQSETMIRRLMERWGKERPEAMAQWAGALSEEQGRGRLLKQAILIWSGSDLEAAIAYAQTERVEATRSDMILGLAFESLQHDARRGLELAAELPVTTERDELLEKGVLEWASSDSTRVVEWVREIPETELRDKLMAAAAIGMSEVHGHEAAGLASSSIQSTGERDRAVVAILQRWVQSAPADALEWLGRFPEGDLKRAATRSTVATWGAKNPQATRNWIDGLPSGSLKDWALSAIQP